MPTPTFANEKQTNRAMIVVTEVLTPPTARKILDKFSKRFPSKRENIRKNTWHDLEKLKKIRKYLIIYNRITLKQHKFIQHFCKQYNFSLNNTLEFMLED